MLTFYKGDGVKIIDPESALIPTLKKTGWALEGEEPIADIEALKQELDELGVKYHHKAGVDKLLQLLEEAKK